MPAGLAALEVLNRLPEPEEPEQKARRHAAEVDPVSGFVTGRKLPKVVHLHADKQQTELPHTHDYKFRMRHSDEDKARSGCRQDGNHRHDHSGQADGRNAQIGIGQIMCQSSKDACDEDEHEHARMSDGIFQNGAEPEDEDEVHHPVQIRIFVLEHVREKHAKRLRDVLRLRGKGLADISRDQRIDIRKGQKQCGDKPCYSHSPRKNRSFHFVIPFLVEAFERSTRLLFKFSDGKAAVHSVDAMQPGD